MKCLLSWSLVVDVVSRGLSFFQRDVSFDFILDFGEKCNSILF